MPLQDAKQCRDVARDVVDHLPPRRPAPPEKHAAHADEWLGIGVMGYGLDAPGELLAEPALAANIGRGGADGRHRPKAVISHFAGLNELATPRSLT